MAQPVQQVSAHQNKGTLIPGQVIAVNKYNVQVERYLSQGGFAHVYLVRTATPIFNTTHHVLKRIAVPNESMLSEVKKEVDIMRLLRGHPNIVYLIDAAWHQMPNGTYEVFILMEFCPGGGIIDMMNRRLRERLTEQEILTIFADVCEGLAAMHSLKPPILHRDLKVENVLQSSATSYKLCDFGSASYVQRVPTNTQEMRLLEADLNRHTTLQYRAPEMVDLYLRRPIDEKSDVWALGVLLYKLCYYTTPFEEHGPLAILNVQYKIPPYPVYSQQMNTLIASMLREHGAQRPSVFEILEHVHRLRGTKPRTTYAIPPKEPLSPRALQPHLQALSPNVLSPANPLDGLVTYKGAQQPAKNAGVEAREKVLESIAPMRRGRPTPAATPAAPSHPASPKKAKAFELDMNFGADEDRTWKGAQPQKSGAAKLGSGSISLDTGDRDAWGLGARPSSGRAAADKEKTAFESDFASPFGKSFGDAFEPARSPAITPATQPPPSPRPAPSPRPPSDSSMVSRLQSGRAPKDAFEDLALPAQLPQQTLGEARKSRTGLASLGLGASSGLGSGSAAAQYLAAPGTRGQGSRAQNALGLNANASSYRSSTSRSPVPSPQPPHAQLKPRSRSPGRAPASSSWRPAASSTPAAPPISSRLEALSAEERFPSLEDLDREFGSPSPGIEKTQAPPQFPTSERPSLDATRPPSRPGYARGADSFAALGMSSAEVAAASASASVAANRRFDGVRSQHVTGTAMRESKLAAARQGVTPFARGTERGRDSVLSRGSTSAAIASRPSLTRRHRSSISVRTDSQDLLAPPAPADAPPALPPRPPPEPRDWLTGMDDDEPSMSAGTPSPVQQSEPVLRASPSKRASVIERSPIQLVRPLEAESVTPEVGQTWMALERAERPRERELVREGERERAGSAGSSRSPVRTKAFITRSGTGASANVTGASAARQNLRPPPVDTKAARESTPSSTGLTENWSPIAPSAPASARSSSSDEGPEDVPGGLPLEPSAEKVQEYPRRNLVGVEKPQGDKPRRPRPKGRQSSVHDLVDLWGGGVSPSSQDRDRESEKAKATVSKPSDNLGRSGLPPSTSLKPPSLGPIARSESPQSLVHDAPLTSRALPARPPSSQQRAQPSIIRPIPLKSSISSATPAPASGRARPQSMFLAPVSVAKSLSAEDRLSPALRRDSLAPAPANPRHTPRRSSISDMVQRYEAIGAKGPGSGPPPSAPPVASKPAALKLKQANGSAEGSLASPSSAATRFPRLSPSSSPVSSRTSLEVPESPRKTGWTTSDSAKERLVSRTSVTQKPVAAANGVNGLPARRTPSPLARSITDDRTTTAVEHSVSPFPERRGAAPTEPPTSPGVRSPSPERPFQGVSKLIDRWNRAVDDTEPKRSAGFPVRRAGVVGGDTGRAR
ncbi:hypothetical protein CERSUDRAFT_110779 [Gelatoporia subvermispora B]|uniref:non-specific serine/threonine protein kinase n=1 Tax=Ceriporiopsis subvermispora (strain B) TaxID=914234 RepID=M2RUV8_CERS8|nr:hypothetical protein CERSUDRAFT_110779 [Gelatoporia subvermispora B]